MAGNVIGIDAAAPVDATGADRGIASLADHPEVLEVRWLGGACDHAVDFVWSATPGGYTLGGQTDRDAGCSLVGIRHVIHIRLDDQVMASAVEFVGP